MLNMREIEAFRAVMICGSLSGAARLLNTAQPNITRLIANLERTLGYPIFIRRSRGVVPTSEAEILYFEVDRSFRGLAEITRAAEEIGQFKEAHLNIGTTAAPLLEIIPSAVAAWREKFGDLSIALELRESRRIHHWIRARRFDLGIVSPIYDTRDVRIIAQTKLSYVLMAQPGNKLLSRKEGPIEIGDLGNVPLIVPGLSYILALCRDSDMRSTIQRLTRIDSYISQSAAQFAMAGLGVALVDVITARFYSRQLGAVIRPLKHAPVNDLALIASQHPVHARAATQFAELLTKAIEEIAHPQP